MRRSLFFLIFIILIAVGCTAREEPGVWFDSYRDIPGVTEAEIRAVEGLRARHDYFIYGMLRNDEAFISRDGTVSGFAARMCEWLSELFDIPFIPVIYDSLPALVAGLSGGEIHFTGQLPRAPMLDTMFYMTQSPISKRTTAIVRWPGSRPLAEIQGERPVRFAFAVGSALPGVLRAGNAFEGFEEIFVASVAEAAALLERNEVDAYIGDGVLIHAQDFPYFSVEAFYPFIFGYMAFSTPMESPDFFPIVDIVQRALENGGMSILSDLYALGAEDARRHNLNALLTDAERAFIAGNPVIPISAHGFGYPISYFCTWHGGFQGIAHDILRQTERITGLTFDIVHTEPLMMPDVQQLLRHGDAYLAAGIFRHEIHPFSITNSFFTDRYALLSRLESPVLSVSEVVYKTVGVIEDSVYEDLFLRMFPQHHLIRHYGHMDALLDGLEAGEVDLAFSSLRGLIRVTNYLERPGFRANIVFDEYYTVSFAVHPDMPLLTDLMNKALAVINTQAISQQWMGRTFDYSLRILQRQLPWLITSVFFLICALALLILLYRIQQYAKKKQVNEAKGESHAKTLFLARMSHEIRTPMNAILGLAEVQLRKGGLPAHVEDAFYRIHHASHLLMGITNDILDISKVEAGKMEIVDAPYNTAGLIWDAAQLNIPHKKDKDITFALHVDPKMPTRMIGDELRIKQILNNLLSNAFKYTTRGTVTLSFKIDVGQGGSSALVFDVTDTGRGMDENILKEGFSDYTRFSLTENWGIEGYGLGLPITYLLVHHMNGEITSQSRPGEGSSFTVRIPQGMDTHETLGEELVKKLQKLDISRPPFSEMPQYTHQPMPHARILAVDDLEINQLVIEEILSLYEIRNPDLVATGEDAIQKIRDGAVYDVIFMDHMMPGMDGVEATKILRDMGYAGPIVALTANTLHGMRENFLENGFDDFIPKPIDLARIDECLKKYVPESDRR